MLETCNETRKGDLANKTILVETLNQDFPGFRTRRYYLRFYKSQMSPPSGKHLFIDSAVLISRSSKRIPLQRTTMVCPKNMRICMHTYI